MGASYRKPGVLLVGSFDLCRKTRIQYSLGGDGLVKDRKGIAGCVIFYYPDQTALDNLEICRRQVDRFFVIDNSDDLSPAIEKYFQHATNIEYIANDTNLGVATALNIAAGMALKDGYDFLLTMDQDSQASPDMVGKMLQCLSGRDAATIGTVSYTHLTLPTTPYV